MRFVTQQTQELVSLNSKWKAVNFLKIEKKWKNCEKETRKDLKIGKENATGVSTKKKIKVREQTKILKTVFNKTFWNKVVTLHVEKTLHTLENEPRMSIKT